MSMMTRILEAVTSFFRALFEGLFPGGMDDVARMAGEVLRDSLSAFIRNLAAAGIRDGAGLIVELRHHSREINEHEDWTGAQKRDFFLTAAKMSFEKFGGDLQHGAVDSLLATATEILHQPEVAERESAPAIG